MSKFFVIIYTFILILCYVINFSWSNKQYLSSRRVINGSTATINQFPYQAGFIRREDGKFYCGGAIFNVSFVITSAHCFLGPNEKIDVVAGNYDRRSSEIQRFRVLNWYKHPDYNRNGHKENDIALVEIIGKFWDAESTKQLAPIDLIDYEIKIGTLCTSSGWGKVFAAYTTGFPYLQYTTQVYVDFHHCLKDKKQPTPSGVLCLKSNSSSMCYGDSGGPTVHDNKLVGVLSRSRGKCKSFDFGNIYTSVYYHKNWIHYNHYSNNNHLNNNNFINNHLNNNHFNNNHFNNNHLNNYYYINGYNSSENYNNIKLKGKHSVTNYKSYNQKIEYNINIQILIVVMISFHRNIL